MLAQNFCMNSRLIYPTAHSVFPLGSGNNIPNQTYKTKLPISLIQSVPPTGFPILFDSNSLLTLAQTKNLPLIPNIKYFRKCFVYLENTSRIWLLLRLSITSLTTLSLARITAIVVPSPHQVYYQHWLLWVLNIAARVIL